MKKISVVLILMMLALPASAGILDLFKIPSNSQTPSISNPEKDFRAFLDEMFKLNTPSNIHALNVEMQRADIRSIRVYVKDYQKSFFVVRGFGVLREYPTQDMMISLTSGQIRQVQGFMADGKISSYERFKIWLMVD